MADSTQTQTQTEQEQGLDLFLLLKRFLPYLLEYWYVPLLLMLVGAALMGLRAYRSYTPMYKSEAVFSVSAGSSLSSEGVNYNYYYDNNAAKQITETFPYLL